jgi:hypothetical protein
MVRFYDEESYSNRSRFLPVALVSFAVECELARFRSAMFGLRLPGVRISEEQPVEVEPGSKIKQQSRCSSVQWPGQLCIVKPLALARRTFCVRHASGEVRNSSALVR